jgi:hypothetical protein
MAGLYRGATHNNSFNRTRNSAALIINLNCSPVNSGVIPLPFESMLKRYAFLIAFLGSLLVFAAINVDVYFGVSDCCRLPGFDSYAIGGFPFPWYSQGGFVPHPNVDWSGVTANVVVAIIASYAIGKIVKWVFVKPEPLHPTLKPFE